MSFSAFKQKHKGDWRAYKIWANYYLKLNMRNKNAE